MDKKHVLPVVAVAMMGCVAMMLAVIGGLYAFNTFVADAPVVNAQATDRGPTWTVTPINVGSGNQLLVVIADVPNPLDSGNTKQMAVYELRGNNGKCDLYFVGARTLEYDFKFWDLGREQMTGKQWGPAALRESAKKLADSKPK